MGFLTSLFGGGDDMLITAAVALVFVLVLIVLAVWLLKLLSNASQSVGRGRNRRLAIIDTIPIDQKRQAILLRRDGIEHLIVTGGPQDIVVETGIEAPAQPVVRPVRRPGIEAPRPEDVRPPAARIAPPAATVPSAPGIEPQRRVAPPAAPAEANPAATPLQRLRNFGQPPEKRAKTSLRHTGLLRPVGKVEPAMSGGNSHKAPAHPTDSGRTTADGNEMAQGAAAPYGVDAGSGETAQQVRRSGGLRGGDGTG